MKKYISINQENFVKIGKTKNIKINAVDAILFDWIQNFTLSQKALKKLINNKLYIWVSYKAIREDNPMTHINTNDAIARRLNKLVDLGILEKYLSKKDGNKMFFHITEFAFKHLLEGKTIEDDTTNLKVKGGTTQKFKGYDSKVGRLPTQKSRDYRLKSRELPTQKSGNSKLIESYNSNKKEIYKEKKEFTFNLSKKQSFDNLSNEYKAKLKKVINESKSSITYEYFENSCLANGYKYKNFHLAFIIWRSKSVTREITNIDKQKEDPFLMYLDFRKDGMSQEVAEVRAVHQTSMKYPSTKTFNEAIKKHEVANFVDIFDAIDEEYGTLEDE